MNLVKFEYSGAVVLDVRSTLSNLTPVLLDLNLMSSNLKTVVLDLHSTL